MSPRSAVWWPPSSAPRAAGGCSWSLRPNGPMVALSRSPTRAGYLSAATSRQMSLQVETGYFRLDPETHTFKRTLKGAALMTLSDSATVHTEDSTVALLRDAAGLPRGPW